MSGPRLVVCGLEPGPAVALTAGALLAAFRRSARSVPVLLGADLPLWRLLYGAASLTPRVLDPRLVEDAVAGELYDAWAADADLTAIVAVEPALDRWEGIKGSRAVDVAAALDAPLVLVVDARDRGATAAAAACGARLLSRNVEFAGAVVVGGDDQGPESELRRILEETAKLPLLGWLPSQLSEQFARRHGGGQSSRREIGTQPVKGGEAALCREAAGHLDRDGLEAAAARRGFLPSRPRRLLTPHPAVAGLKLAVAWGPPLEPFALEAIDLFKAMGSALEPLHIGRDKTLPEAAAGLFLGGLLDEEELPAFAGNQASRRTSRRPSAAACRRWRWAAAPCCCCAASPTVAGGRTSSPASCRPRPNFSSGTSVPGTYAPRRRARTRMRTGRPRCTSSSIWNSSPSSRRPSPGAWARPRGGAGRGLRARALPRHHARAFAGRGAGPGGQLRRRHATGGAGRVSFAALEAWLRTRRGLFVLWLVTTVTVTVVEHC